VIESLPSIKVPVLVLCGSNDKPFLAATDYMAKKMGGKKTMIPNAGHASNIDQPELFNDAILTFLSSLKGGDAARLGNTRL
jgi:pimeloyl-ACP methyl ester carboxylesterase